MVFPFVKSFHPCLGERGPQADRELAKLPMLHLRMGVSQLGALLKV